MATKGLLLLSAVFLTALAAQGAQAKVLLLAYGVVPCSSNSTNLSTSAVFPNAGVTLVINSDISISDVKTNCKGQFLVRTDLTMEMLDSLLSNSSKVVVTTPLSECNPDLPSAGRLTGPVCLLASRRLNSSAADNQLRGFVESGDKDEILDALYQESNGDAVALSNGGYGGGPDGILRDDDLPGSELRDSTSGDYLGGLVIVGPIEIALGVGL